MRSAGNPRNSKIQKRDEDDESRATQPNAIVLSMTVR